MAVAVWVDDIVSIFGNARKGTYQKFWRRLNERFNIKDLGDITRYIGMRITRFRHEKRLCIDQATYFDELALKFQMINAKGRNTPMSGDALTKTEPGEEYSGTPLRSLIGSLMYPAIWTRPDILYSVTNISQFMENPTDRHWKAALDVVRYTRTTSEVGLEFKDNGTTELVAYADSDWAGDLASGKSVYGYLIFFDGNLVSWKSKKSDTIATSSTTAELEGAHRATTEIIWLRGILEEIGIPQTNPTILHQDNKSAIAVMTSDRNPDRTKHETIRIHFLREKVENGIVRPVYCPTGEMRADMMTKPLGRLLHWQQVEASGLKLIEIPEKGN